MKSIIIWTCPQCKNEHKWYWNEIDLPFDNTEIWMVCDKKISCGKTSLMFVNNLKFKYLNDWKWSNSTGTHNTVGIKKGISVNTSEKTLLTQDYIRAFGLEKFIEKTKCLAKMAKTSPNLILLKYDQLESDMSDPMVQECRGLILDSEDNWNVACMTFYKFFNYGDISRVAKIDWNSAEIFEKKDGSLIQVYWHKDRWMVSTSGVPDAETPVADCSFTFKELFLKTWKRIYPILPLDALDAGYYYAFELNTPFNKVVVDYPEDDIVLLAVRNATTLEEDDPDRHAKLYGLHQVKKYDFADEKAVLDYLSTMTIEDGEGFVVRDRFFNRIKMKCEEYVRRAHLKEGVSASLKNAISVIQHNEIDEVVAQFPRWKPVFDELSEKYNAMKREAESFYDSIKHLETQKDFALEATKHPFSGILFSLRAGKIHSIAEGFEKMPSDYIMKMLGYKYTDFLEKLI